jgi:RNA-binding protein
MPLTGRQNRHLRGLGHHLDPVVQLGKHGLTDGVTAAVDEAIGRHELVKVRLGTECPDDRHDVAAELGKKLKAEVAQVLGRTILLYRRHPKKPVIVLPGEEKKLTKGKKALAAKKLAKATKAGSKSDAKSDGKVKATTKPSAKKVPARAAEDDDLDDDGDVDDDDLDGDVDDDDLDDDDDDDGDDGDDDDGDDETGAIEGEEV